MADAPIFAHLHSSPLVVRRHSGSEWRSLSSHSLSGPSDALAGSSSGLEPVDIIDVKEERKLLVQCLREAKKRIVWHSEVADLHTFRKVLSFGCRALHFSGHGVPGKVIFENKKCEAQFISQQELKDLLLAGGMGLRHPSSTAPSVSATAKERLSESKTLSLSTSPVKARLRAMLTRRTAARTNIDSLGDGDDADDDADEIATTEVERGWISLHPPPRVSVKLVFLSACHSESVAEAFVSAGVPHVVVVSKDDKVLDRKAMEFSKAFYTALFAGHSVARAFEIGQVQADISITSSAGSSKFKLLGHGDHTEALFRDAAEGLHMENTLPPPGNDCDAVAEVFVGRSLEVHQVYKSLVEGARLISITGDRGIGKTEIALQSARYATDRRVFKHIYFMRLEETLVSPSPDQPNGDIFSSNEASIVSRIARAFDTKANDELELANQVRQQCVDGSYLLILDGCNRKARRDPQFRAVIAQLLRRVSELAILITGDGKIGAMDGVAEKIISVESLPPADAALLFTLRAPRRLKAHEMGGTADLLAFSEHPIIRSLSGHPRSICAVAQFLEKKDMELDKHEFLNYIIPSVTAGLAVENCDEVHRPCFPALPPHCHIETHIPPHHHLHHHLHDEALSTPFVHHHHPPHPHHRERWSSMPVIPVHIQSDERGIMSTSTGALTTLLEDQLTLETARSDPGQDFGGVDMTVPRSATPPRLVVSQSENGLLRQAAPMSSASIVQSQAELCAIRIADSVKALVEDEEGRMLWASALISNAGFDESSWNQATMQQFENTRTIPMEWLAPAISRYFATKLKSDAVKRPLSVRSIDFLAKSTLVWGTNSPSPSQLSGSVSLEMFAHFWHWFAPLVECVAFSKLWSFTQPRLLHGFLSKGACVNMLQHAPPGTFLLRFSETRLRCFVIVYVTEQQSVQFVPVTCQKKMDGGGQEDGWYVSLEEDGSGVTFASVQDLILSVTVLKFLFPQTPKEIAFSAAH